ncbi:vitamin K epoxide reductase family protein [Rubrivirga sp.]|uniref:vitamin K epoxide reductase family protein n=1 Tax=Rubrivirga sp. TaxID=1885344 RepID=UPI003B525379
MALPAQTSLLRRLLVGVALLGVVVVTHLALQKANGFAAGCTGLGDVDFSSGAAVTGEGSGCATVTEGEYADFLGIPNITLGLIFYVIVAGLRLAYAGVRDDRLRLASFGVVTAGLLYTAYLVYLQAAVIGSFCALCMTSAAIVLTLFALHVIEHRRLTTASDPAPRRAAPEPAGFAALRPYVPVLGGFAVLLAATFGLAARTDGAAQAADADTLLPPRRIEDVTGACTYDADYLPIDDMTPFTQGPSLGDPGAAVTVVEVFDPNCPHCRELSEVLHPFIEENPDAAQYFFMPHPLRQESIGQVVALKVAQREGRFFELMDEMFRRQDATWGMTMPELVETLEAVGMDGAAFEAMLKDDAQLQGFLTQIQADAEAVTEAFTSQSGRMSVPKLAINGRVVESTYASYSERCLAEFVAEAQAP